MIMLFGLAGSGKSTQGQILARELDGVWLSVGEVLRRTQDFDEVMKRGDLVDDDEVIKIMTTEIEKVERMGKRVILDGYPRDEYQAKWLVQNMAERLEMAIYLEVPKEELMERLLKRGRADDTKEAIEKRFAVVEQNICSILSLFEAQNVPVRMVSGVGEIEEIAKRTLEVVKEENNG